MVKLSHETVNVEMKCSFVTELAKIGNSPDSPGKYDTTLILLVLVSKLCYSM